MDQYNQDEMTIDLTKVFENFLRGFKRMWKTVLLLVLIGMVALEMKEILFFNTTYTSEAVFVPSADIEDTYYYDSTQVSSTKANLVDTFNSNLTSKEMKNIVKDVLNVSKLPAKVSGTQIENTNLVVLKVTAKNAKDAYDVATAITNNCDALTKDAMQDVSITLLDKPTMPQKADASPNYLKAGLMGGLIGLGASALLLIVLAIFRRTVLDKNDVRETLGLDYVAKIPYVEKNKTNNPGLLVNGSFIRGDFKHSFHNIRIKMEHDHRKNKNSVYMITSTVPNEGKTMVSINTAITLGQKGYKVCLVDLDMRNPSVEKTMRYANIHRTSLDFIKDEDVNLEQCIVHKDDIDIIFGSDISVDGSTELSKPRLENLIEELREVYDFIILDVTPLYMMEDALLVAKYADSAVVVVKQDYAEAGDILDSVDELHDTLPHIVGVVINSYKKPFYSQESAGGYGYGYGYGRSK